MWYRPSDPSAFSSPVSCHWKGAGGIVSPGNCSDWPKLCRHILLWSEPSTETDSFVSLGIIVSVWLVSVSCLSYKFTVVNYQRYCDNIILSMTINHSETENSAISIFVKLNRHLLPSASNNALADKLRGVAVYLTRLYIPFHYNYGSCFLRDIITRNDSLNRNSPPRQHFK